METIPLGQSGLKTSRIGLGTWAIGGAMWGGSDAGESISTIHAAIDHGVTLIDTAPAYGFGRSEEILGKALEGGRRAQVQIATKAGLRWGGGAAFRDARPQRIRQEVEDSLRRLRTDRIDLYQVHWPDPLTPLADTATVLDELRRDGKVLAVGVSNFTPAQMNEFRTGTRLDTVQSPYNLFERDIEADVLPHAQATGLTVLSYGALCRGLLSGAISDNTHFRGDDLRKMDPKFRSLRFRQYLRAVDELEKLALGRFGKPLLALALRWVLDQGPTIALWGARRPEQLRDIAEVDGWQIDDASRLEIDAILARCISEPIAPSFMAPPARPPLLAER
jgi:aryl-alcohol dehydrogenase-like predicted oxidoreductase